MTSLDAWIETLKVVDLKRELNALALVYNRLYKLSNTKKDDLQLLLQSELQQNPHFECETFLEYCRITGQSGNNSEEEVDEYRPGSSVKKLITFSERVSSVRRDGSSVPPPSPSPVPFILTPIKNNRSDEGDKSSTKFEFGGPIGVILVMLSLPLTVFIFFIFCNQKLCLSLEDFCEMSNIWRAIGETFELDMSLPIVNHSAKILSQFWTLEAFKIVACWYLFLLILYRVLPGDVAIGLPLPDGSRLSYCMNGHLSFWISILFFLNCNPVFYDDSWKIKHFQSFPLHKLYDIYIPLATASLVFSILLSMFVHVRSYRKNVTLSHSGQSKSGIYNFFMGRDLNPRVRFLGMDIDIKEFCELRPGLIGWVLLNIGFAQKQILERGFISPAMMFVVFTQGVYVWDSLVQESAILSTMDITAEGFGWMLAFGDLVYVPFLYSNVARYLSLYDPFIGSTGIGCLFLVWCFGFYIFRGSNSEKNTFRLDPMSPDVAHLKTLPTKRGTRLLIDGFFGYARKINYSGDIIMGVMWCLSCGFPPKSPLAYFYAINITGLLVHRAYRDDELCERKYGSDWDEYRRRVPAMFIPKVI